MERSKRGGAGEGTCQPCLAHLAGGVVEHLLPRRVQPVLVSHDALLGHKHHLPGSIVHANSPLVSQGRLLCLLLGLGGEGCQGRSPKGPPVTMDTRPGGGWKTHHTVGFTSQTALRMNAEEEHSIKNTW